MQCDVINDICISNKPEYLKNEANAIIKNWGKISLHRHFNRVVYTETCYYVVAYFVNFLKAATFIIA